MGPDRRVELDQTREPSLDGRHRIGADVLGHQQREPDHELGPDHLPDQRLVVQPVEDALRVQRGVLGTSDVEDLLPRNEDVVEDDGAVELVTGRGQWVVLGGSPSRTVDSRETIVIPGAFGRTAA